MFWADRIAKQIIEEGVYKPYWVDDMKTPSGRIHVGSLRGVVIHDLLFKALKDQGKNATYTYCINDMDPMDGFPEYLDREKFYKYMGWPLCKIPPPEKGYLSFSEYFAKEFIDVFNVINCCPQIIWTSSLYAGGKFDSLIKIYLNNTEKIRKLFEEHYKNSKYDSYFPYQPICPNCGKISTTKIYKWDGEYVHFECKEDAVEYTKGCGFKGKIKPEKQNGKLPWKIEWSAHWKTLGVTIEWSGKDHMTAGGSHEIASKISEEIIHYPTPHARLYEYFLIGGQKMSSSKGRGASAKEVSQILPPYLLRFLFTRTDYRQAIDFEPFGTMVIPDLFDEYDRCWQSYNNNLDEDFSRAFILSQIEKPPQKDSKLFLPRFIDVVNYAQSIKPQEIANKFAEKKGSALTLTEKQILTERINYAAIWISRYAPLKYRYQLSSVSSVGYIDLPQKQRKFLEKTIKLLEKKVSVDDLNLSLYNTAKELDLDSKSAFGAIYRALIGKDHGPKAAWLLTSSDKNIVIERLTKVLSQKDEKKVTAAETISKPEFFTIDQEVKQKYPSISVGIAYIKEVHIEDINSKLEEEKKEFLITFADLTTEKLGKYAEILSYRKLYKEMGVDWHSKRPSPEALLRRIALGKGLYTVNTCVDAYNLVVMKHRISVGAFDFDKVKFPTILRYAIDGDKILLLGDKEPTKYTSQELAYYDKEGGYNIDFNYRDAKRTMVTGETQNLWINVDGVYDITPLQVEKSLHESVELIIKYCGGKVEFEGVVK